MAGASEASKRATLRPARGSQPLAGERNFPLGKLDLRCQPFGSTVLRVLINLGFDSTGTNRVHTDLLSPELYRQHFGERYLSGFRGSIGTRPTLLNILVPFTEEVTMIDPPAEVK